MGKGQTLTKADEIGVGTPRVEEFERVGELLYLVDPYIYPALFGSPETARVAMPKLMSIENSPFAPCHVSVARMDGVVTGIMVLLNNTFERLPELAEFYESELPVPQSSRDVCERYLLPLCEHACAEQPYIACIATSPEYRGRGVASALLRRAYELANGYPLSLDVLQVNEGAIRLYEKHGFVARGQVKGYAYSGERPDVIEMRTN